jgi:hypothetical protein
MRWATIALCSFAALALVVAGAGSGSAAVAVGAGGAPDMTLLSQSLMVTPAAPWFNLSLGMSPAAGAAGDLHVNVTIYSRLDNASQLQQSIGATPDKAVLLRDQVPVAQGTSSLGAAVCVTVLPDGDATAPAAPAGSTVACPANGPAAVLGCTPDTGTCGDVYPVSVALYRQGDGTALERFTTFMTYQEPGAPGSIGTGGPLDVAFVAPVGAGTGGEVVADALAQHRDVPATIAAGPRAVSTLVTRGGKSGHRVVSELVSLAGTDQLLPQPYVPIDVAGLVGAGLAGEVAAQVDRGLQLLRQGSLHPSRGPWVDTASDLTASDGADLATGLKRTGSTRLVLSDGDLAPGGNDQYTFAQPFSLSMGHGAHVTAAVANSQLDSRFDADRGDPVLAADQLVGSLNFVHFENADAQTRRGVVLVAPAGWKPQSAFVDTLLDGLDGNPALAAVTLDQFFARVPEGGNQEPTSRHLQSGPGPAGAIPTASAKRIALSRAHLTSFAAAVSGHPAVVTELGDQLLTTEASGLTPSRRAAALDIYTKHFDTVVDAVSLAPERTITFTSRTANIPITVDSSASYPVTVVMTLASDKFEFPDGSTRTLHLDRPTTPVRVEAKARASGDNLPVEVTLRTPDGQLVIAHDVLTVHSTSISIVGIALTVLAGLTLLVWWARTWRRGRRHRPRAH